MACLSNTDMLFALNFLKIFKYKGDIWTYFGWHDCSVDKEYIRRKNDSCGENLVRKEIVYADTSVSRATFNHSNHSAVALAGIRARGEDPPFRSCCKTYICSWR